VQGREIGDTIAGPQCGAGPGERLEARVAGERAVTRELVTQGAILHERRREFRGGFREAPAGNRLAQQHDEVVPLVWHREAEADRPGIDAPDVEVAEDTQHARAQRDVEVGDGVRAGR
jgi:hypothetical protein